MCMSPHDDVIVLAVCDAPLYIMAPLVTALAEKYPFVCAGQASGCVIVRSLMTPALIVPN